MKLEFADQGMLKALEVKLTMLEQVQIAQKEDKEIQQIRHDIKVEKVIDFIEDDLGINKFKG